QRRGRDGVAALQARGVEPVADQHGVRAYPLTKRQSVAAAHRSDRLPRGTSAPLPKFVIHCGTLSHELRKQRGTSKHMILVALIVLRFKSELAAGGVELTSGRH